MMFKTYQDSSMFAITDKENEFKALNTLYKPYQVSITYGDNIQKTLIIITGLCSLNQIVFIFFNRQFPWAFRCLRERYSTGEVQQIVDSVGTRTCTLHSAV